MSSNQGKQPTDNTTAEKKMMEWAQKEIAELKQKREKLEQQLEQPRVSEAREIAIRNQISDYTKEITHLTPAPPAPPAPENVRFSDAWFTHHADGVISAGLAAWFGNYVARTSQLRQPLVRAATLTSAAIGFYTRVPFTERSYRYTATSVGSSTK